MKKTALILIFITLLLNLSAQNFRDSIKVSHYKISLDFTKMHRNKIFGNIELTIIPKFPLKHFCLDLESLNVDSVIIRDKKAAFTLSNNIISISLSQVFTPKDTLKVLVYYGGEPRPDKSWGGFYFKDDYAYNYGIAMASDPVCGGRFWYPCIDNFTNRATYEYYILTPSGMKAATNGEQIEVIQRSDKTSIFHYKLDLPVPTYLTNIAVGDYLEQKSTYKGIEISNFVFPKDEKKGWGVMKQIPFFLDALSSAFGPYRWNKIGYVCTPFYSGAMEHVTLISYPFWCVDIEAGEFMLLHEFGHQWFGNLITCKSTDDMWFNEGGASYCEAVYCEYQYGKEAFRKYVRNVHNEVLISPINHRALFGVSPETAYEPTVYKRGSLFFHGLRGYMGDSLFFKSFRKMFLDKAMTNMKTPEIQEYLSVNSGLKMDEFFKSHIYQSGFSEIIISNMKIQSTKNEFDINLELKQNIIKTEHYPLKEKVELLFMNREGKMEIKQVEISGELQKYALKLPFKPDLCWVDPEEKLMDGSVEEEQSITKTGATEFNDEELQISIETLSKPTQVFVRKCIVNIDQRFENAPISQISNTYWQVEILHPDFADGEMQFSYKDFTFSNIENQADLGKKASQHILLFKRNYWEKWQVIPAEFDTRNRIIKIKSIKSGYFAVGL